MRVLMLAKKTGSFHLYQMSSDDDYFYVHPESVLLGFLGVVIAILIFLLIALCMGFEIR
jgi:hypothetical protein